jgi:hypothetical protein
MTLDAFLSQQICNSTAPRSALSSLAKVLISSIIPMASSGVGFSQFLRVSERNFSAQHNTTLQATDRTRSICLHRHRRKNKEKKFDGGKQNR